MQCMEFAQHVCCYNKVCMYNSCMQKFPTAYMYSMHAVAYIIAYLEHKLHDLYTTQYVAYKSVYFECKSYSLYATYVQSKINWNYKLCSTYKSLKTNKTNGISNVCYVKCYSHFNDDRHLLTTTLTMNCSWSPSLSSRMASQMLGNSCMMPLGWFRRRKLLPLGLSF